MKINEVLEELGISRATLTRYRKKLGIFEETKSNISKSQFKELEKLANQRQKYTRQERVELSRKTFKLIPKEKMLEIRDDESVGLKNLKAQYNYNQKLIENFQLEINKFINDGDMPGKYLVAPFAGAWIEIGLGRLNSTTRSVAPFAGAWIEIRI